MKKKIFFLSILFVAGAIFLLSVQYQSKQVKLGCPQEVKAATSNLVLPFDLIPALKATLEITGSGSNIPAREIGVQLVPKHANRQNSPRLIQLSQVQLNDVPAGNYHLKVTLKQSRDDLTLATLDLDSTIQPGTSIDFGQAAWNYDVDPDGDRYNSITEIMNGKFVVSGGGEIPNLWLENVKEATGSAGSGSYPNSATLLRYWAISVSSLGSDGRIRVMGDPFSVQSGVNVIAELRTADGVLKSTINGYSRIDGSFDLPTLSNAIKGDKVHVFVSSRTGDGNPSSLGAQVDGPSREVLFVVKNLQRCE